MARPTPDLAQGFFGNNIPQFGPRQMGVDAEGQTSVATLLNSVLAGILSLHDDGTDQRPGYLPENGLWIRNNEDGNKELCLFDGQDDHIIAVKKADGEFIAAPEAMAKAEEAKKSGSPLFTLVPSPTGVLRPGYLFTHLDNGVLDKEAFPQAYEQLVQDAAAGAPGIVRGEAAWQAAKTANGGVCPLFMLDTDNQTFRVPYTPGLYFRDVDPANGLVAGGYLGDASRRIYAGGLVLRGEPNTSYGAVDTTGLGSTGFGGGGTNLLIEKTVTGITTFDSANIVPTADENRPVTAVCPIMIKMYGEVVEGGEANIAALIQMLTNKVGTDRFDLSQQIFHVQDKKPENTKGGTFTSGAWRTRDLNREATNTVPGASLANNQITLPIGTYVVDAWAQAYGVRNHKARLFDVTHDVTLLAGEGLFSYPSSYQTANNSNVKGVITLTSETVIELQHQCYTTVANTGFGYIPDSGGSFGEEELYAEVVIRRIA